MAFQKDLSNRMQDTVEKVLCSSSKVPYIIDWLHPNVYHL